MNATISWRSVFAHRFLLKYSWSCSQPSDRQYKAWGWANHIRPDRPRLIKVCCEVAHDNYQNWCPIFWIGAPDRVLFFWPVETSDGYGGRKLTSVPSLDYPIIKWRVFMFALLTCCTPVELGSETNPQMPALGVNSYKTSHNWWVETVGYDCVSVCITSENLHETKRTIWNVF